MNLQIADLKYKKNGVQILNIFATNVAWWNVLIDEL